MNTPETLPTAFASAFRSACAFGRAEATFDGEPQTVELTFANYHAPRRRTREGAARTRVARERFACMGALQIGCVIW